MKDKIKKFFTNMENIVSLVIVITTIILGILIANAILGTNKRYFYGYNDMNGHSRYCYEADDGVYCDVPIRVDWFYEDSKHE